MDEAAEPLGDVADPAGLAVFAVADDVDPTSACWRTTPATSSRRVF